MDKQEGGLEKLKVWSKRAQSEVKVISQRLKTGINSSYSKLEVKRKELGNNINSLYKDSSSKISLKINEFKAKYKSNKNLNIEKSEKPNLNGTVAPKSKKPSLAEMLKTKKMEASESSESLKSPQLLKSIDESSDLDTAPIIKDEAAENISNKNIDKKSSVDEIIKNDVKESEEVVDISKKLDEILIKNELIQDKVEYKNDSEDEYKSNSEPVNKDEGIVKSQSNNTKTKSNLNFKSRFSKIWNQLSGLIPKNDYLNNSDSKKSNLSKSSYDSDFIDQFDSDDSKNDKDIINTQKNNQQTTSVMNTLKDNVDLSIIDKLKSDNNEQNIESVVELKAESKLELKSESKTESKSIFPHFTLPITLGTKGSKLANSQTSEPIYADYASLTPVDPRVKKVMFEAMDNYPANPSSLYKKGVEAKKALEEARTSVANFFGAHKNEIIFTSGGTESNNMVFQGILKAFEESGSTVESDKVVEKMLKHGEKIKPVRPHFIISTIEHPSIIEIALDFINKGIDVSFIPVNSEGLIDPKDIRKAIRPETILISVIYANNEIGTIQPLKEISREVRHFKKTIGRDSLGYPYIHTDACQAALYEDMRIMSLNIDLMTIDGGKVYGPRGVGALVKRRHVKISPIMLGGSQEMSLRAGTENLPSIIGLKHALDLAHSEREDQSARLLEFRETLLEMIISKLQDKLPGIKVNGSLEKRLPNNLNICFPGIDAEFLVLRLDVLGVLLSSVTSCRATNDDSSSYVVEALGRPDCALSSLRITLGRFTTTMDIGNIAEKVAEAVGEQVSGK